MHKLRKTINLIQYNVGDSICDCVRYFQPVLQRRNKAFSVNVRTITCRDSDKDGIQRLRLSYTTCKTFMQGYSNKKTFWDFLGLVKNLNNIECGQF